MSNFQGLFSIRDGINEDRNFVLATFLRGLYYGNSWFSDIPKDIFMSNYKRILETLLDRPDIVVKIACLPDEPSVILGYSVLSGDYQTVHWVYVKQAWRKKGIGRTLTPAHPAYASHLSQLGKSLLTKLPGATFNPFSL